MNNRIALALAACEGLSDEELAKRGPAAFGKMIQRKRAYAQLARQLAVAVDKLDKELEIAKEKIKLLESLDADISDTSEAAAILDKILNNQKQGGE